MARVSRKKVEYILEALGDSQNEYRLIIHQMLGDRKDYWYQYSIIKDTHENGLEYVIKYVTLKEAYDKAVELLKRN